jgi:hypothetical protein
LVVDVDPLNLDTGIKVAIAEKRQSQRLRIEREIRVTKGEDIVLGMTENISRGGAHIRCEPATPLQMGDRIHVSFTVPGLSEPIEADAEVRWTASMNDAKIGIQFTTGFRAKQTWALNQLFDQAKIGEL